ncbi:MAG TPA: NAD-dependent epimerase/dehydratase family protein [Vicinamibacteria bacterium]|nr:NAD-dependent epimerase/dehydratase family protein [Vicinamibacteria bacterium]
MRLAVTGASGFVGGHLLRAAAAAGHEAVGVVRSAAGAERVREAGAQAAVAALDRLALSAAFEGAAAVVHLAHIGSERGADTYEAVNVAGTRQVVAAAWDARVPRVVMLSGLGVARYGLAPRVTSRYFRSKLEAEQALFSSALPAVVLRPSYVLGAGDAFVPWLLAQARTGVVELPGDGSYRMQPLAVEDAAAAILAACDPQGPPERLFHPGRPPHRVFDLVGPEPVAVREFARRLFAAAAEAGTRLEPELRAVAFEEADRQARAGGWQGMPADELDCLLCDEVADHGPLEGLLGRPLLPVDTALRRAVAPLLIPQ